MTNNEPNGIPQTTPLADERIAPFTLAIPDADVADLRDRLARTRYTTEAPGADPAYGASLTAVRAMAEYWQHEFDWRAVETRLAAFPQFLTTVDGQPIHFLHVRSAEPGAFPIVLTHGWPGSFAEFADMIAPLVDPVAHGGRAEDAFHVVVPSVPGYAFSAPVTESGWGSARVAAAWDTLMKRLGYERYGAHGGDGGSLVGRELGILAPEGLVGTHVLQLFSFPSGDPTEFEKLGPKDYEALEILKDFGEISAFATLQSTRPQTLAHALADSPVGQLAWNELMATFDRPTALTRDQILTHVSLYWFTNTAGSSARQYKEDARFNAGEGVSERVNHTPTGVSVFKNDFHSIRPFAERDNDRIVFWKEHEVGGHFAAMEVPDILVADLREFFAPLR
ncbi:epoxide hydrolase family protein [Microbacterium hydrocarbonoxydans]|uniref:epoxide hydrolase family protein n=1 Tax=Microbacterium hydrocarbonoxydans TaxID=273678 RepID=UPI0013DA69BF|nr:epoxide hydrolase family protein [Microbacterium hydrocarbonoxydans]